MAAYVKVPGETSVVGTIVCILKGILDISTKLLIVSGRISGRPQFKILKLLNFDI